MDMKPVEVFASGGNTADDELAVAALANVINSTDFAGGTNQNTSFSDMSLIEQLKSSFGAWLVFMEMGLALVGMILNLTVIIAIKEKESLMNNTVNIILGNLCCANLVSTVFVKSIAVVYHGYAVARDLWEVRINTLFIALLC